MKPQTIFSCAALTISMASMVVTLPKVSLAHDHDLLLAQDVQTIIAQGTSVTFTDIAKNPYQTEIIRAQELNIVQGFPDGTFRPNQPVTREQAVSMIVDAIALMTPVDLNATPTSPVRPFLDVPGDRWSAAKINWAQWNLLPAGTPTGRFRPEEPITRADLVSFLRRAAERIKTNLGQPPVLSPTQEAIAFTDVSGFNQQLTEQMSAFCQVASPVNEKGTKFAPNQPAHRDYTAAAIVRTLNCLAEGTK
jgi:hypothetical protein